MVAARPTIARAMSEKALQANVNDAMSKLRWLSYHTWLSKFSAKGFPDIVAIKGRRGIAAELKREGKDPTPEQEAWLEAFGRAGFEVYTWRPSDWLDGTVLEILNREEGCLD